MSDVAWGIIGALGGAIIGVATTIAVDFFKRKAEKTELKISVLSALSANALRQYRLVCSVIGTTVNMKIAAATASHINTKKIAYDSEEASKTSGMNREFIPVSKQLGIG